MEKTLNKKIETYVTKFKNDIREKITELNLTNQIANELMTYIYDYERLVIDKDDLNHKKRSQNTIPEDCRCTAIRTTGEQCTRRKKKNSAYCGTHDKNGGETNDVDEIQKIEVFTEEVRGIVYYLDNKGNVYNPLDILSGKENPRILAKYFRNENGVSIPELGI